MAEYEVVFKSGHAWYVEFGNDNPNYPAQPFLTPACKRISIKVELQKSIKELEKQCRV